MCKAVVTMNDTDYNSIVQITGLWGIFWLGGGGEGAFVDKYPPPTEGPGKKKKKKLLLQVQCSMP